VVLILAGEGSAQAELEELAQRLGISDRICFAGNRTQQWLARAYPEVSVVLAPYTGRALAEAALGAAAVVAYDVEWHAQFIEPGVTGELVPFMDHEAMAEAAERLLDDPGRARKMGEALREKAVKLVDPAEADRSQAAAYEALLR
jgi:glycosyltransferase involved in cell wall biosynthesis